MIVSVGTIGGNFKSIPLEINEYVIDFKLNNKRYDSTLNEVFIEDKKRLPFPVA